MTSMADDSGIGVALRAGLLLAVVSAVSFRLSGSLARGLIDVGWSPGAVVLARIALGALVVAPLTVRALRARWGLLRRNLRTFLLYGAVPVAGTQFAFFSAVAAMDVAPALLIEYTAPAAVVMWLWLRHRERPRPLTLVGAGIAAVGLVLVLDLLSGAALALGGRGGGAVGVRGDARGRDVLRHVRRYAHRRAAARPGRRGPRGGRGRPGSAR